MENYGGAAEEYEGCVGAESEKKKHERGVRE